MDETIAKCILICLLSILFLINIIDWTINNYRKNHYIMIHSNDRTYYTETYKFDANNNCIIFTDIHDNEICVYGDMIISDPAEDKE